MTDEEEFFAWLDGELAPADAARVPSMLDYERHRWSREPAAYRAGPRATPVTTVARLPVRERVLDLLGRAWR